MSLEISKSSLNQKSMWIVFGLGTIWGSAFFSMRSLAGKIAPESVVFIRVALAGLFLLGWSLVTQRKALLKTLRSPTELSHIFVVGMTNFLLPFLAWTTVAKVLPSSLSAMINGSLPVFGSLYAVFFLSEKLKTLQWLGIFWGFIGVIVLAWSRPGFHGDEELSWWTYFGNILLAVAAVNGYAYASIHMKKYLSGRNMLVVNSMGNLMSAILLMGFLWAMGRENLLWSSIPGDLSVWLHLANLGLICSALAFVVYFSMLSVYPASVMLSVAYWVPVMGAVFGVFLLDERLSIGMICAFATIFLAQSCVHQREWVKSLGRFIRSK